MSSAAPPLMWLPSILCSVHNEVVLLAMMLQLQDMMKQRQVFCISSKAPRRMQLLVICRQANMHSDQ